METLMAFAAPVLSLVIEHPLLVPDWLSRRAGGVKGIRSERALETLSLLPEGKPVVRKSLDSDTGYATRVLLQDAIDVQEATQTAA